jgi:type VI secretion system protein ImpE
MNSKELFDAGRLSEAVQALGAEVRNHPTDARRRTFLFELLCFAGEFDRAAKQLDVLAQDSQAAATGGLLYRAALHAERTRQEMFEKREYWKQQAETPDSPDVSGLLNGKPFQAVSDGDSRLGRRLEVFAAGAYLWIPYEHIVSIDIAPPRRLRDLLWATARVRTGPAFKGTDLGEVLLPVLAPLSWKHSDDNVKLGRSTAWSEDESGNVVPSGQRILFVDDEEIPFLEVRKLEFTAPQAVNQASS